MVYTTNGARKRQQSYKLYKGIESYYCGENGMSDSLKNLLEPFGERVIVNIIWNHKVSEHVKCHVRKGRVIINKDYKPILDASCVTIGKKRRFLVPWKKTLGPEVWWVEGMEHCVIIPSNLTADEKTGLLLMMTPHEKKSLVATEMAKSKIKGKEKNAIIVVLLILNIIELVLLIISIFR